MNIDNVNGYSLKNLNKINIILGKNGCGKSTLLRKVEMHLTQEQQDVKHSRYLIPERGGLLNYEAGIEQNIANDVNHISTTRRRNQLNNFRQQSVVQYRKLKDIVLEAIERNRDDKINYPAFDTYITKINSLLDNVEIRREQTQAVFSVHSKSTGNKINSENLSSGESELISLGIECLVFAEESKDKGNGILFLDEPDVHLHPDLQVRLMHFIKELVEKEKVFVVIATHSTALLGSLENYLGVSVGFMKKEDKEINFENINFTYKKILPIFGAHPLSNIFNEVPILILEGEDEERIWQQVVRSSQGKIKIYPCSADGVGNMQEAERDSKDIIDAVYDNAKGYSLRDRDDVSEEYEIEDIFPIIRCRLSCRNSENLILSNESLNKMGIDWNIAQTKIKQWTEEESQKTNKHPHFAIIKTFVDDGFLRKNFDLKKIRNSLFYIFGIDNPKPWEVIVGQAIAENLSNSKKLITTEGSIFNFLGEKFVNNVLVL